MATTHRNNLAGRLATFGGRILQFVGTVPKTRPARHVEDQLTRSGTAVGAHYAEAQGAQSSADFVYKLSLALKEAREALYWLQVAEAAEIGDDGLEWLLDEGDQIVAMLQAAKKTAQGRAGK